MKKLLFIIYVIFSFAIKVNAQNTLYPSQPAASTNLYHYSNIDTNYTWTKGQIFPNVKANDSILSQLFKAPLGLTGSKFYSPKVGDVTGIYIPNPDLAFEIDMYLSATPVLRLFLGGTTFGDANTGVPYITRNGNYTFYGNTSLNISRLGTDSAAILTNSIQRLIIGNSSVTSTVKFYKPTHIDTVNFLHGTSGSITQNGQVCKIFITNPTIGVLTEGKISITNSYCTAQSIINVSVEYTTAGGISTFNISTALYQVAAGSFTITFTPTVALSLLNQNIWLHYSIGE